MTDTETRRELEEIGLELGAEPPPPPPLPLSGLMPQEKETPGPTQRLMFRITLYILGACLFVAVAGLLRPERTVAAARRDRAPSQIQLDVVTAPEVNAAVPPGEGTPVEPGDSGPVAPERNAHGWPLLGTLHGAMHEVWAYASPEGPRYTVIDEMGNVLLEDAPADDVYRTVPEVDLTNMQLEPGATGGPLMMVDEKR